MSKEVSKCPNEFELAPIQGKDTIQHGHVLPMEGSIHRWPLFRLRRALMPANSSASATDDWQALKAKGNDLYKVGDLQGAHDMYSKAIAKASPGPDSTLGGGLGGVWRVEWRVWGGITLGKFCEPSWSALMHPT